MPDMNIFYILEIYSFCCLHRSLHNKVSSRYKRAMGTDGGPSQSFKITDYEEELMQAVGLKFMSGLDGD